jgi:hypothetical protein
VIGRTLVRGGGQEEIVMKRVAGLCVVVVLASVLLASCQTGVTLWGSCTAGGDPTGTDGHYVLVCEHGEWTPIMTVQEYIEIARGGHPTIGTLPQSPPLVDANNMVAGSPTLFGSAYFCSGLERDEAQTFMAGITGQLNQIAVIALRKNDVHTLDVSIQDITGRGSPDGVSIGSGDYSGPGSPNAATPINIPLAQPAHVVAGKWYTVVFSASDTGACTDPTAEWDILGSSLPIPDNAPFGPAWARVSPPAAADYHLIETFTDFLLTTWVIPGA